MIQAPRAAALRPWAVALVLAATLGGCRDREVEARAEVTVGAAASLQTAMADLEAAYEQAHDSVDVVASFASSGTLQRQIEQGAPIDVFLSAADAQMDALERADLVVPQTRRVFASNELVLIVPAGAITGVRDFRSLAEPAVGRVAIGAPESVPAGAYALEVFRSLGVDGAVLPKTVRAQHVRQVLAYVQRGEVDAGVVYRTDAATSQGVRVVTAAPIGSHAPIQYPLAVVRAAASPDAARAFAAWLLGSEAAAILGTHGFRPSN